MWRGVVHRRDRLRTALVGQRQGIEASGGGAGRIRAG